VNGISLLAHAILNPVVIYACKIRSRTCEGKPLRKDYGPVTEPWFRKELSRISGSYTETPDLVANITRRSLEPLGNVIRVDET
jgi:hypothetical protein